MSEIRKLLDREVTSEFEVLKGMDMGTEEYKTAVDGITKLVDRAIEIDKLNNESLAKERNEKEERKDRLIKNILTGLGIAVPAGLSVWGTIKSLRFEQEGTVTTILGRGWLNKLLPKK